MKKFFKWTGIVLGGLIALTFLAGLVLYPIGMKSITRKYTNVTIDKMNIPADADAITRGRHVSVIWACTKCHGEDLSGKLLTNDPIDGAIPTFGAIPASNLTSGNGGIGSTYTDTDWVRTIRHGLKPNNQAAIYMYVSTISDQDLGDLIAYLKQIPPVDSELPAIRYGPFIPILPALGMFMPAAELIDHNAPHPADPSPGATKEYGRYLSGVCMGCHSKSISRTISQWSQHDFVRTFHSGVLLDGRKLGATMSSRTFSEMTDTELTALWLYFTDVNTTK